MDLEPPIVINDHVSAESWQLSLAEAFTLLELAGTINPSFTDHIVNPTNVELCSAVSYTS